MTPEQRIANLERDLQALEVAHNDVSKTAGEINRVIANYLLVLTKTLCQSGTFSEEVAVALTEKLVSALQALALERSWEKPTEAGSDAC